MTGFKILGLEKVVPIQVWSGAPLIHEKTKEIKATQNLKSGISSVKLSS